MVTGAGKLSSGRIRAEGGHWDSRIDAQRFGRNFASIAFAQFVAQVLTLAASIVLARKLDVEAYGIFVFGFAFPSWFLLLVSLGLDEVIAIEVAADRARASQYLTLVGLLRFLLGAVAMTGLWIATQFVLDDPYARTVTVLLGASSVVSTFAGTFTSVFRAFEKLEYGALVIIIERFATVGTVILLLFLGFGLLEVSLAFLGGSFVSLALSAWITRRRFAWFAKGTNPLSLAGTLGLAMPFGLFNMVGTFTYTTGLVLLTLFRGPDSAGLFNASFTLLFALFSFLSIVSLAALPMMSRIGRESRERLAAVLRRIQKLSLILGVPLALGGWLYASDIVTTFYGDAFEASAEIFRILIVSFAIETAAMGIGPALAATGHAKEKLYIASGGGALTVGLSFVLIPPLGLAGAAYAFLASRVLVAVVGGLAVRRYVGPLNAIGTVVRTYLAGSAMVIVLVLTPGLSLWTGILVGGFVYFATLWGIRGISRADRDVVREAVRGALGPIVRTPRRPRPSRSSKSPNRGLP